MSSYFTLTAAPRLFSGVATDSLTEKPAAAADRKHLSSSPKRIVKIEEYPRAVLKALKILNPSCVYSEHVSDVALGLYAVIAKKKSDRGETRTNGQRLSTAAACLWVAIKFMEWRKTIPGLTLMTLAVFRALDREPDQFWSKNVLAAELAVMKELNWSLKTIVEDIVLALGKTENPTERSKIAWQTALQHIAPDAYATPVGLQTSGSPQQLTLKRPRSPTSPTTSPRESVSSSYFDRQPPPLKKFRADGAKSPHAAPRINTETTG